MWTMRFFFKNKSLQHKVILCRIFFQKKSDCQLNSFNVSQLQLAKESAGNHINFVLQKRESRQVE